jgi:hypothetical protein
MTSTIKVNTITTESGSTLTVGGCGKTVALASGASQTGFGRTGTVDWQTGSIKTTTFTAANGEGYFADTSSGAITMNLPAGTAGNIVSVVDYTNTFQTHNLTIAPNGSQKIGGVAASIFLNTEGQSVTFVYVDDTEGWKNVQDSTSNVTGNANLVASGGTETTCGNDKIHTFTGPGTFTVSQISQTAAENIVSYMVIGGGGGGGRQRAGGAGAGGFRELKSPTTPYTASPLDGYPSSPNRITVTATGFPIAVGAGGVGAQYSPSIINTSGSNSQFSTIIATGGGAGANPSISPYFNGQPGGSGGGGVGSGNNPSNAGGSGNTPSTTPSQGNDGGDGSPAPYSAGGGGGAGGAGGDGNSPNSNSNPGGGNGGVGITTSINGTPTTRAGGGGGGAYSPQGTGGLAGPGGGGAAGQSPGTATEAGTVNTGGGGGGGMFAGPCAQANEQGAAGGSGIVIIRYKFQ